MKKIGFGIGVIGILVVSVLIGYYLPALITENKTSNEEEIVEQVDKESYEMASTDAETDGMMESPEEWLKQNLETIIKPLGWLAIISDPSSGLQDYCVEKGNDILKAPQARQLFVMEDILQDTNNFKLFTTLVDNQMETYEAPTDEMAVVYLPYDVFNNRYEELFNEPFDIAQSISVEALPDKLANSYVYYDNRRPGANGVGVDSFEVRQVDYDENSQTYKAILALNYSERAAERLGRSFDSATLKYQVAGNQLVLKELHM